jgi:hypothetical protein
MVVLACTGRIEADVALFANVGDDSEHPASLAYVRDVATPWAAERGLRIEELHRVNTRGAHKGKETLLQRLTREGSRSLPIPVRMPDTGAPGTRSCTADFKIRVISRRLAELGATPDDKATVLIGISLDEIERAGRRRDNSNEVVEYPLLDLRLTRQDCINIIRDAGLPIPGKSSCWFCPFHRPQVWREMRRDEPDLFERAAALEDLLNERRDTLGKDHVYLTRFGRPLRDAINEAQPSFDFEGIGETGCDEGVCFV